MQLRLEIGQGRILNLRYLLRGQEILGFGSQTATNSKPPFPWRNRGKLASVDAISAMNVQTGMTAWVTGDPVDGIFLTIPLSAEGEAAVRNGSYVPAAPSSEHLATQGKDIAAFYVGVYAGSSREARKKIMTASAVLRVEMFGVFPA